MKALPVELRRKILEELTREPSSLLVGANLGGSASVARKLRPRMLQTGSIQAGTAAGRGRLVEAETEARLTLIVGEFPDATLYVLRELPEDETGVAMSETTLGGSSTEWAHAKKTLQPS